MPRSADEFANRLWAIVDAKTFVRHPFWGRVASGAVTREQLAQWAAQYYLRAREFSRWLSAIHSRCPDQAVRNFIAINLYEEHGDLKPERDHPAVYRKFTRALGVSDAELEATLPLPETQAFVDRMFQICQQEPFVVGLAAIGVGIEGNARPRPERHGQGLGFIGLFKRLYQLDDDAVEFWTMHTVVDCDHSERCMNIITQHATSDDLQTRCETAVRQTLQAWRLFFDGCNRAYLS
ncbi:MAG: iron-containing redox enzyme family protein [Deltaproteobacteria bacterium]|nr:iron-containing redox enzyme family protein [Deltaproteobacteria bacterium]MBI3390609.1 iron-containing redox enzyme family protein [Deltaproteobacteria bacterium]